MSEVVNNSTPHKHRGILGTSAIENTSPAVVSSAKQQHVSQRKRVGAAVSQTKSKELQQTPIAPCLPSSVDLRIPIQINGGKEAVHVALRTSRSIDVSVNQTGIPLITSAPSMSKNCIEPLVDRALMGFNANILVLGPSQSSSRTSIKGGHMWGSSEKADKNEEKENSAGASRFTVDKNDSIVALSLDRLFCQIEAERAQSKPSSFLVAMSVMSISPSDALVDCLTMGNPSALPLKLQQDAFSRLQIVNLTRRLLHSKTHALKALQPIVESIEKQELKEGGNKNHVIVIVHIERKDGETGVCSTSQLQFIDLAAMETYNTSLLALEKVVTALAKIASDQILHSAAVGLMSPSSAAASQAPVSSPRHIPYRESKLTRLLKFGLGGSETPSCRTHSLFLICTDSMDSSDAYIKFAKKLSLLSNNMSTTQEGLNIVPAIQSLHFQLESAGVKLKHHTNLPVISASKTAAARLPYSKQDPATSSRVRRQLFDASASTEKTESACKIVAPIAKKAKATASAVAPVAAITTASTPTPPTHSTPAKAEVHTQSSDAPSSAPASGSARRWKFGSARSATKPVVTTAPQPAAALQPSVAKPATSSSSSSSLADASASMVSIHSASKRLSTTTDMMMCPITEGEEISSTSTSMESKASLVDTPPKVVAVDTTAVEAEVPLAAAAVASAAVVTPAPTRRWTFKNKTAPPAQNAALMEMERKYKEMEIRLQDALTEVQSLTAQQVESEREIAAIKSGQISDSTTTTTTRLATETATLQCDLLRNEMDVLRQQINDSSIQQTESTPQLEAPVSNASPEPEIELTFILDDESLQHGNVSTPSRTGLTPTVDFLSPTSSLEGASPCQFIMDDLRGTFSSAADELEHSRSASPPPVRGRPSFRLSIVRESFGSNTSSGRPSYSEQYDEDEEDDEELSELDEQLDDDNAIDQADLNEIEEEAPEVPVEEPFTPAAIEKEEEVVEYEQEEKFDTESNNHILAAASPAAPAATVKSIPSELLEQIRLLTANANQAIQQQQPAETEASPVGDSADIINSSHIVPEVMEPIAEESFSADVQEVEKEEEPEVVAPIALSELVLRLPFYCPSTIIHSYTTSTGDNTCFPTCIAFLNGVNFPLYCARTRRVVPLVRFVSINPVVAYFPFKSTYSYHHASAFSSPQARSNVARARARAAAVAPATPLAAASAPSQQKANDAAMTESQALIDRAARIKAKKDAEWQQATLMQKIGCSVM